LRRRAGKTLRAERCCWRFSVLSSCWLNEKHGTARQTGLGHLARGVAGSAEVSDGIARPEFDNEISLTDGHAMLEQVFTGCVIEKVRYCVL
jgi:hypothetical protein